MGKQEFKFLQESVADIQKKLNQWSHQYEITLHGFTMDNHSGLASVMVERVRKDD